ncbi:MAG: glycosyltransferase family A protein [Verrucomicrobiota bacterium]
MTPPPLVSIVTPLHNKVEFFAETARSVFEQTIGDFEWIVVDDASTDGSAELLEKLGDPRLRKQFEETNRGPCSARNIGLALAEGEWVLFLDADDRITPDHLQILIGAADCDDIVAGGWIESDACEISDGVEKAPPPVGDLTDFAIAFAPWAVHAAILRREHCPKWPKNLDSTPGEDIAFWFHAIREAKIGVVEKSGAVYRKNTPANRSAENRLADWYEGVSASAETNIALAGGVDRLTAKQAENLMRLHETYWHRARRMGDAEVERAAAAAAGKWLAETFRRKGEKPLSVHARRILGLKCFQRLADRKHNTP